MNATLTTVQETATNEVKRIFELQRQNQFEVGNTTVVKFKRGDEVIEAEVTF